MKDPYYIGVVDRGGEGFGIWFPDLPGCTSGGKTMQALFRNGMEAVALWVGDAIATGEAVPAPRSLDALLGDPDVRVAIDDRGTLIEVPMLIEDGRPVRANISLDSGLLRAIDAEATRLGLTRSGFLASAARAKLERRG